MLKQDRFYFRVKGNAMKEHRIMDGDIVLIDPQYVTSIVLIEHPDSKLQLILFNNNVRMETVVGGVMELYIRS